MEKEIGEINVGETNFPVFRKNIKYVVVGGCWECVSHCKNSSGYPYISINKVRDTVARHVYRMFKGKIGNYVDPNGKEVSLHVRHTCDNRVCINPDHLILGTNKDNMRDREERNPQIGERNPNSKLKTEEVIDIFESKLKHQDIARKYNISRDHVATIKRGKRWGEITCKLNLKSTHKKQITKKRIKEIINSYNDLKDIKKTAEELKLPYYVVWRAINKSPKKVYEKIIKQELNNLSDRTSSLLKRVKRSKRRRF